MFTIIKISYWKRNTIKRTSFIEENKDNLFQPLWA